MPVTTPGALSATATAAARGVAAFVDATIALVLAVIAHGVSNTGGTTLVPLDRGVWVATLVLFALRDVASGASLAKWMLGLRLEMANGAPTTLADRLRHVPFGLSPLGLVPAFERRTPWRVAVYVPSGRGLAVRAAAAAVLIGGSAVITTLVRRPSIGRTDALQLAQTTILGDPHLADALGGPLAAEVGRTSPHANATWRSSEGDFELRVRGTRAMQTMVVRARKVDGQWAVEEVTDIEQTRLDAPPRGSMVHR